MRTLTRLVRAVLAVALAWAVTVLIGPSPAALGYLAAGDRVLVGRVRGLLVPQDAAHGPEPVGFRSLAVAVVDDGGTRYAFVGDRGDGHVPDESTTFELASVTKTFTAFLLVDAVSRREVRLDSPVAQFLPELDGTAAGSVTLTELATHRSGLPAYADMLAGATYEGFGSADLQAEDEQAVITQSEGLALTDRGTLQYSNLGVSLLGFALARAAAFPSWEDMVRARILEPYGMTSTTFARVEAEVPSTAAVGHRINGTRVAPVTGGGYLPAGTTTFTTAHDLALYGAAILRHQMVGSDALIPQIDLGGGERQGLIWWFSTVGGHEVAYHLGGVPGFASAFVIDPDQGRAVAVLGSSEESVEPIAFDLLDRGAPVSWLGQHPLEVGLSLVGLVLAVGACAVGLRSRRILVLVAAGLVAQSGLLLLYRHGPWHQVHPWWWALPVAGVLWTTLEVALRRPKVDLDVSLDARGIALAVGAAATYGAVVWMG